MNILKSIIKWVVFSSKDPARISLTLKGIIPFLVLLNFGDSVSLGEAVDSIVNLVVLSTTWVTGAVATYGALRKVYLSVVEK